MATRIKEYQAYNIAGKVAHKAFEHLFVTIDEQIAKLAKPLYDAIDQDIGFEKLLRLGVIVPSSDFVPLHVYKSEDELSRAVEGDDDNDKFVEVRLKHKGYTGRYNSAISVVTDEASFDKLSALAKRRNDLCDKQYALDREIRTRLKGKTRAAVSKAWPELDGFVADELGVEAPNELVIPFESLLARFLPMLPAPKEQG